MIGRVKPGLSLDQVRAALPALEQSYRTQHPDNIDAAVNGAFTAWHLHDWVWGIKLKASPSEQKVGFGRTFDSKDEFKKELLKLEFFQVAMATKADVDDLRAKIAALEAEMNRIKNEDIASLRKMADEFRAELTKLGADVEAMKKYACVTTDASGVITAFEEKPQKPTTTLAAIALYYYSREVLPLFVTLNMIPKVALGPLIIVWFSYGIFPNILIAFSICFFPILLTTARGLSEVEPDLLDLVKSLRGSRWTLFRKVQLPGCLPYVFSGMKVGAILAVAGAIVGEFIASERGLGYLMIQVQSSLDTPAMVMAVILLTLLGVALYGLVLGLERLFVVRDIRLQ